MAHPNRLQPLLLKILCCANQEEQFICKAAMAQGDSQGKCSVCCTTTTKKKSAAVFPRPVERLFRSSVLCLPTIHLRCFSQQTSWEWDNEGGTKNCWVERLVLMVTPGPKLLLLAVSGTVVLLQLGSVLMFTVPITTGAYLCKPRVEGLGP